MRNSGIDAAIVKFRSSKNYQVATIGNYDIPFERKQWVFVSGFISASNSTYKLTSGVRFSRNKGLTLTNDNSVLQFSETGYELIYTNLSQVGMGGGPVLDREGRLIGINAGVEGERVTKKDTIQIGYSFGVPASKFTDFLQSKVKRSQLLNITNTAAKELTETEITSIKNHKSFAAAKPDNDVNAYDWLNYGNQLWRSEKFDEAIMALEKTIKLDPDLYQAYYALGLVYLSQKEDEKALEQFDITIEFKPGYYQAWREKSRILNRLKKHEEALIAIDKAILWEENDFNLYFLRGNILYDLKRFDEAIQAYTKSIAIKPDNSGAYNSRGIVYKEQKKIDLALADFTRASAPNYIEPSYNASLIYFKQQKWQRALTGLNRVIKIDPDYAKAYFTRGQIWIELGEKQKAIQDLRQAAALFKKQDDMIAYQEAIENLSKIPE